MGEHEATTDGTVCGAQEEFKELHVEEARPKLMVRTRSGGPQTPDDSPVAPKVRPRSVKTYSTALPPSGCPLACTN